MGVSTLHASNIKGKIFQFVQASHPASCVDWAQDLRRKRRTRSELAQTFPVWFTTRFEGSSQNSPHPSQKNYKFSVHEASSTLDAKQHAMQIRMRKSCCSNRTMHTAHDATSRAQIGQDLCLRVARRVLLPVWMRPYVLSVLISAQFMSSKYSIPAIRQFKHQTLFAT